MKEILNELVTKVFIEGNSLLSKCGYNKDKCLQLCHTLKDEYGVMFLENNTQQNNIPLLKATPITYKKLINME